MRPSERLPARGYQANGLHGDISQAGRERVLRRFRDGRTEVLVATDVAARGLDVPDVSLVVNFDIPPDPEYYVHRIGRTGRVGRGGAAITFVNPREMRELRAIERATGARIRRGEVPTAAEAEQRELQLLEGAPARRAGEGQSADLPPGGRRAGGRPRPDRHRCRRAADGGGQSANSTQGRSCKRETHGRAADDTKAPRWRVVARRTRRRSACQVTTSRPARLRLAEGPDVKGHVRTALSGPITQRWAKVSRSGATLS